MMKNRWKRAVSVAAVAGLLLCQCGCSVFRETMPEEGPEAEEDVFIQGNSDLIVVGFSQLGSESVWRSAHSEAVQRALTKENGYFLIFNNARQRQENQIKAIRSFISQRVDYIIFAPVVESGWDTVLEEAREAEIPVIILDRAVDADDSLYTTWIGTDSLQEGEWAAKWLEADLREKKQQYEDINIVMLQGTLGASAEVGRTRGFEQIASKYGNWHILEKQTGDFTTAKGKEVMQQFLKKYPDIDVVVSQNDDMTFGALEAISEAGLTTGVNGDITVISFDAVRAALEMVQEGRINADIECNPEQGEEIARIIQLLENDEPVEKSYIVEEKVFTRGNVSHYLEDRTY